MNGGWVGRLITDQWLRSKKLAAEGGRGGVHEGGGVGLGIGARIGHCQHLITRKWCQSKSR